MKNSYLNLWYNKLNESLKEEVDDIEDITGIFDDYGGDLGPMTKEDIGNDISYRKLVKSVDEAEKFNYHSDYGGDADTYQKQNVDVMEDLEPFVDKTVTIRFDDGEMLFKVLGLLIDKQYNDISHSVILVEEILNEGADKSNNNTQTVYVVNIGQKDEKGNSIPWEIGRFDNAELAEKEAEKRKGAGVSAEEEDLG